MNDLDEQFTKLKNDIIVALAPPWWENWILLISFICGVIVGYAVSAWTFL
jgi:hypothetical protein